MTRNPSPATTMEEKLQTLFQDQALRNAQRRKDASTFQQFGESIASEEGGRWAKPTQVVGSGAAPEYPRQPEGSFSNQSAIVPPEEPLGFSVDEAPIVGEVGEVAASIERLERAAQEASPSLDVKPARGAGAAPSNLTASSAPANPIQTIKRRRL
jgi:hypothetical protein